MSDGMSDARAEGELAGDVWDAAFDLGEDVARLARAVQRARMGHRGWSIHRAWIVAEMNNALKNTGFELVDRDPQKSFEQYPGAYERRVPRREKRLADEVEKLKSQLTHAECTYQEVLQVFRLLLPRVSDDLKPAIQVILDTEENENSVAPLRS